MPTVLTRTPANGPGPVAANNAPVPLTANPADPATSVTISVPPLRVTLEPLPVEKTAAAAAPNVLIEPPVISTDPSSSACTAGSVPAVEICAGTPALDQVRLAPSVARRAIPVPPEYGAEYPPSGGQISPSSANTETPGLFTQWADAALTEQQDATRPTEAKSQAARAADLAPTALKSPPGYAPAKSAEWCRRRILRHQTAAELMGANLMPPRSATRSSGLDDIRQDPVPQSREAPSSRWPAQERRECGGVRHWPPPEARSDRKESSTRQASWRIETTKDRFRLESWRRSERTCRNFPRKCR